MNGNNKTKDIIIVGFALFAIFFGAGNLIFPPYLGVSAGEQWKSAMFGFLTTDPIFPILGVIVTAKVGGKAEDLGKRVGKNFSKVLQALAISIIGPLFAVPRTSATTHEIFIAQLFPKVPLAVTSLVFFGLTLFFVLNQSKVIEIIGKYLTPGLVIILTIIIVVCIAKPIGPIVETPKANFFISGFYEGYQTMDALGSALMAGIVVNDLVRRGYTDKQEQFKAACGVGVVAFILLAFVYGGLTYVGATAGSLFTPETSRVDILVGCVHALFGTAGKILIGIAVALACLTTSTGLTAVAGDFFSEASNGKLSYRNVVIVCTIIAFAISLIGVEGIIMLAVPVLSIIYPVVMVLILFNIFDAKIKYNFTYTGAVVGTLIISVVATLNGFFKLMGGLTPYLDKLPLRAFGLEWLVPALIMSAIFTAIAAGTGAGGVREDVIKD